MPARKRPIPVPGEKWNPKKHANRRISSPVFVGHYTDSGQRVFGHPSITHSRTESKIKRYVIRSALHSTYAPGIFGEELALNEDERKKPYRYRKPKK